MRIGIVGKRGAAFIPGLRSCGGVTIAAVCERDPVAGARIGQRFGIDGPCLTEFESFLGLGLDAVVVGTPMQDHATQAISALDRGVHVLSEVTAATSIEECRALVAAARRSSATYMMSENYCFSRTAQLVERLARRGMFGEVTFVEGAYIHDCHLVQYGEDGTPTWRTVWQVGHRGITYGTHSVGPALTWMDDRVATVSCLGSGVHSDPRHVQDDVTAMLGQTARGRLIEIRLDMQSARPHNMADFALQGTRGAFLNPRRSGEEPLVWLMDRSPRRDEWEPLEAYAAEFLPEEWRRFGGEAISSGHGGADYFAARAFVRAARGEIANPIDIDRAMDFTLPGLTSEESIFRGGAPVAVPDSRRW
ncbi:MAG: Gfo/Idh/MocA family oxidoreductase [Chloroflexi bacterium]|nr:Gfo/Idh/MocA family oxidoreductase [Chloroflexota bacterium]